MFLFEEERKSRFPNIVYLDLQQCKHKDVKAEKDKKNISVMSAAPVFGHFLFRFCLHCLLSLFLFFVVGLIQTGVPYNTLGQRKGLIRKKQARKARRCDSYLKI